MSRSSGTITLVLLGAASTAFIGYQATKGPRSSNIYQQTNYAEGGSDFSQGYGAPDGSAQPSTQPTTGTANNFIDSGSYSDSDGRHYYHTGSSGFVGYHSSTSDNYSHSSSGTAGRGSGSSTSSAGTSRGGFGSTGHAVGSASS